MTNDNTYEYGDTDPKIVFDKFTDFLFSQGDGEIIVEFMSTYMADEKRMMKVRNWIFKDPDLIGLAHEWMKEELGWPIMPRDEEKFWVVRFAQFFTSEQQRGKLQDMFEKKIVPMLIMATRKD